MKRLSPPLALDPNKPYEMALMDIVIIIKFGKDISHTPAQLVYSNSYFYNGGHAPSWIVTLNTPTDHPWSVPYEGKFCVKFCVDWSYSFQDIAYSTLYISYFEIWLQMPIHAPKFGILRNCWPLNIIAETLRRQFLVGNRVMYEQYY